MKIAIVSCGTRGDVQPMAALTLGLIAAGHQALLHAPPENEAWATSLGCPFQALGARVRGNPILKGGGLGALRRFVQQEVGPQVLRLCETVLVNAGLLSAVNRSRFDLGLPPIGDDVLASSIGAGANRSRRPSSNASGTTATSGKPRTSPRPFGRPMAST
jgi:hypothetical protein